MEDFCEMSLKGFNAHFKMEMLMAVPLLAFEDMSYVWILLFP